jgi:hypothetical protein
MACGAAKRSAQEGTAVSQHRRPYPTLLLL